MANRDGTGPMGEGSATGRGVGICTGINAKKDGTRSGTGLARRGGFGQGFSRDVKVHNETDNVLREEKDI